MSDDILARIVAEYGRYADLPAFHQGFAAYQRKAQLDFNPYEKPPARLPGRDGETASQALLRQINGQAWDRGACAAMRYERVLAGLEDPVPAYDPSASQGWLARLIGKGRR